MKKSFLSLLVIFLIVSITSLCFAKNDKIQTNRVVVTFSPLVVNNINYTSNLYEVFSKTIKSYKALSDKLEASGALWSISQNLCGLQICISSPNSSEEIYGLIELFLTTALKDSEKLLTITKSDIKPVDRLLQFIIDSDSSTFSSKPVSIRFYDSNGNEITDYYKNHLIVKKAIAPSQIATDSEEIASEEERFIILERNDFIGNYCKIYENAYKTNRKIPKVQSVSKPILANIIGWSKLTPETFITASLIKNRFNADDMNSSNYSIELFNVNNGIVLVVNSDIDSNDNIYNHYLDMCKKIDSAISDISSKEWVTWDSKLQEVMKNDQRDYNKKALFESWCKHWSGLGFDNIPSKLELRKPDYRKEVQIYSSISEHNFNLSADTYPAIYAGSDDSLKEGANIAVCIKGRDKILESIEKHITSSLHVNIPITINQKHSEYVVISFYCPEDKIPAYLSRIKASIANHLYSKFNITDLKESIRIGIAGISSIPAYRLKGLLTLGWPTKSIGQKSRKAQNTDLYAFVKNSNSSDEKNFELRWNNMTSSPKDKANMLALLACYNLTIDSWNRD